MDDKIVMDESGLKERIKQANRDWQDRVVPEMYDAQYDHDADILYISFGKTTEAFSLAVEDDAYLRIDLDTYRIVGMDFFYFKHLFLANNPEIKKSWDKVFELFGTGDWRFQIHPHTGVVVTMAPVISFLQTYVPRAAPELVPA